MSDIVVALSVEELAALAVSLELPLPRILDGAGFAELSEDAVALATDVAARALVAREFLALDGDRLRPPPWLDALILVACRPALVVEAIIDEGLGPLRVLTGALPGLAVEQVFLPNGSVELRAVKTSEIVGRAIATVRLEERPTVDEPGFEVTLEAVRLAVSRLEEGDRTGALDALVEGGADRARADAYLAASDERRHAAQVTALHRRHDGAIEGVAITWVDCGPHGLWELPILDGTSPSAVVTIRPTSAASILGEIRSGLPAS